MRAEYVVVRAARRDDGAEATRMGCSWYTPGFTMVKAQFVTDGTEVLRMASRTIIKGCNGGLGSNDSKKGGKCG